MAAKSYFAKTNASLYRNFGTSKKQLCESRNHASVYLVISTSCTEIIAILKCYSVHAYLIMTQVLSKSAPFGPHLI